VSITLLFLLHLPSRLTQARLVDSSWRVAQYAYRGWNCERSIPTGQPPTSSRRRRYALWARRNPTRSLPYAHYVHTSKRSKPIILPSIDGRLARGKRGRTRLGSA
jgi:hypothetical protein